MFMKKGFILFVIFSALAVCGSASATTIRFECITDNLPGDAMIGEQQLSVEIHDLGVDGVLFEFLNVGSDACSITDVYWDDGSLLDIAGLIDADDGTGGHTDVDFSELAAPPDLPGGNDASPPFTVTSGFSADSDPPPSHNGVNPAEWLGVRFSLQAGKDYQDVLDDLESGALRIGMHVQDYDSGGSESFVSTPLPEPASMGLLLVGGLGLLRRRRMG